MRGPQSLQTDSYNPTTSNHEEEGKFPHTARTSPRYFNMPNKLKIRMLSPKKRLTGTPDDSGADRQVEDWVDEGRRMLSRPAGPDHTLKHCSSSGTMRKTMIRAVGWILIFMGVSSVSFPVLDSTAESPDAWTPHSLTSVILDLRITNRVYNESLADQHSAEYSTLKFEVDQLFADIYALSYNRTHLMYLGTDEMIFSNGSVIATSRLLFGPTQVSPELVRGIFLPAYKQITAPALEIDFGYTDNELPTEGAFEDEKNFPVPTMTRVEEPPLTSTASVTIPSTATSPSATPDMTTKTASLTSRISPTLETPNNSTPAVVDGLSDSTKSTFLNSSTTLQPTTTSVTNYISASNITTTEPPTVTSTTVAPGTITTRSNDTTVITANVSTTKTSSQTSIASTAPTKTTLSTTFNKSTAKPKTSSTPAAPPLKTTPLYYSPNTADLIPGWGVALLAMAGVILFLLIILIILVMVWCCCPRRRVFVNEADEMNPPMYYSPDIPMYSTQSTFETTNNKQVDVREKPPKIRTGMYVVNN
ncbi:hypothetical protein DNTS_016622 [Danionella cerebrum]|uniref:SEA domain-containing protein n=1 Tax=Danionella cerebrum TaxID=2873325 RepID=A0A553N1N4_9TELE|nr:hypothetical protein DNTS_016622 [Danionella translucida]